MPNKRITDLDPINVLDNADLLYIVDNESNQSNKITYGNLAGNSLLSLETDLNTLSGTVNLVRSDITYLSGTIDQIEAGAGGNTANLNYLSGVIDTNYAEFQVVSADFYNFEANSDIGNLVNDVITLSTNLDSLSSEIYGAEGILAQQEDIFDVLENVVAPLSGDIISNTTYVSQVSVVPTATGDLSATHFVEVDLGGTTYKILLAT
tara:strand:+ start:444 stop:1064 length:621 start_codon:yes stop_codon:yes gene_type:complete